MIRGPLLGWYCGDKEVTHIFEARGDVLEFFVVLEAG